MIIRFCYLCVAIVLLSACSPASKENTRPNIVFVLVDDMRWDEFGEGGHNYIATPNIDRLAREGANFKNAFATTPLCSPSRASFLTGTYAHTNGIIDNQARNELSHQLETFPKQLHAAGYETAFMGKWHMGNDDTPRPGWNHWISLKGQGEANDPNLNINGERTQVKGYVTDILTDQAIQFIQQLRDKPFLLYIAHKALHPNAVQRDDGSVANIGEGDFVPAPRHAGLYDSSVYKRRPSNGIPPLDKPALMQKIDSLPPLGPETGTSEKTIRQRAEMLMAVDEGLGKMMQELERLNQLDNTIIVFTSDHGFWYGEHGLNEERRLAYEEAIRIPLLVRYPPKVQKGSRPDNMVLSIDLAPTLVQLAGEVVTDQFQGRSLLPVFENSVENWRSSILIEYYSDTVFKRMKSMGYKAVRNDRYKYIHYVDITQADELYDLQEDPFELKNLIADPAYAETLERMKALLNEQLKETGAQPI
jgi:N-acetylglucosamine-6-sulfatase